MTTRGRPKTSQVKKKLEGNTSKRGKIGDPPVEIQDYRKCHRAVPVCLADLEYATYEWERLYDFVTEIKLLHTGTRSSFIVYCRAYQDWMKACIDMDANPQVSTSETGVEKVHPCVTIKLSAEKALRGALSDFGLKPVDLETRTVEDPNNKRDPMEERMNGGTLN